MKVNIPSSSIQHISLTVIRNGWRQLCDNCPQSRHLNESTYILQHKNALHKEYLCDSCLEEEIGWLRIEMVKVELRRES